VASRGLHVIDVLYVHLDDSPADPPGLRVPAHTVTDLESFHHFFTSENVEARQTVLVTGLKSNFLRTTLGMLLLVLGR
jgi:hypothetical protein